MQQNVNRWIYAGFVLFGLYKILAWQQFSDAAMFMGIALAFDPFDQAQPWQKRPLWQRAWLIVHLAIVAALLGYQIGFSDSAN